MNNNDYIHINIASDVINNYLRILADYEKKYTKLINRQNESDLLLARLQILKKLITDSICYADKRSLLNYSDIVLTLQIIENNNPCFDTGQSDKCGQDCCWRNNCDC